MASGWAMVVPAGIVINPVLRALYGFFAEPPPIEREKLTATKHGALTAVFGLFVGTEEK